MTDDFTPGYPLDLRSAARRKQQASTPVGDFEGMAARVIARLTGERVVIQDDGSQPAMADIRIDYADKSAAYVEVVVDIETSYAAMEAEIWQPVNAIPADMSWQVNVSGQSKPLKYLRKELPDILNHLHSVPGSQIRMRLDEMGVTAVGPWVPSVACWKWFYGLIRGTMEHVFSSCAGASRG